MYGKEPQCDECLPDIMSENAESVAVYLKVRNQHIMGFGGPVDLNFTSVDFVLDMMEIEDKKHVFEKVHRMYQHSLSYTAKKTEFERLAEMNRKAGLPSR